MGQSHTKTSSYQNYYDALQQNQEVDMSKIDPYEVLGVSKNYTWEELVNAYRRLARLVHPDKGGSQMLFHTVTESFKYLAQEFKRKEADKPHHVLKQNYQTYQTATTATAPAERSLPPMDESFQEKFNRLFDENKLDDEDDDTKVGYGHMMEASSKTREDIEIPKVIQSYNRKKFNEVFDKHAPLSKEVIVYKEPEPMLLAKSLQFTEIGGKTTDYGTDPSRKSNLQYTDYMKAHTTTRLIDPRTIQNRKEYKSVEDYEADRANITQRKLDEKELRYQKEVDEYKKRQEQERLERVKTKDDRIAKHYERVNQLFLR